MLRKMCRYLTKEWLAELCEEVPSDPQRPPFIASISEVLAAVLENEVIPGGNPPINRSSSSFTVLMYECRVSHC